MQKKKFCMRGKLFKSIMLSLLCGVAAGQVWADVALENDKVLFKVDDAGNLVSLKNKISGREYAGGGGLWRIIHNRGDDLEVAVEQQDVPTSVKKLSDSSLKISSGGEFPVEILCELVGDEVRLTPEIKNMSKADTLREFQFPVIKNAQVGESDRLITLFGGGRQHLDVKKYIRGGFSNYMMEDYSRIEVGSLYPGEMAANFYMVESPKGSLYVASLDPSFTKTLHLFCMRDFLKKPEVDFAMVKYPFLRSGESLKLPVYVVAPVDGDWHACSKKYEKWVRTWYKQAKPAEFIKKFNGWQRIILRHQYGKQLFKYSELSKIRKAGRECGIDTLFMFGWTKEGHDAGYPEYSQDFSQGGDEALRKNIEKFQSDGGHVIVYYNGQLIDMNTDFYRTVGHKISVKVSDGTEHIERYKFGGDGTALRVFGNKTFATACPACPEWTAKLKELVDRAIALGADGVFFDQLGYFSQSCWDASHPHKVPCMDVMHYKNKMMRELSAYVKAKKPDMSFGIEWVSDCTSQYADYVHACGMGFHYVGKEKSGRPALNSVPVYRYMFPELPLSDRHIRDDLSRENVERLVNTALMWGLFSDVEIYRCRATIDETPYYKSYLAKADRLRDEYRALIRNGMFRDTDLASISDDRLYYTTFENDSQIGVFVSNYWVKDGAECVVSVPKGKKLVKTDGLGGFTVGEVSKGADGSTNVKVSLKKQGLALLVFAK